MFQYRFFFKVQLQKLKLNWKHTKKKEKERKTRFDLFYWFKIIHEANHGN